MLEPHSISAVSIPRARQYDITSKTNGRTYRVMVSTPFDADPDKPYPVLWLLDGNQYFGTATEAVTRQAFLRNIAPAIVVGIGYPTDDPREIFRLRVGDMMLSPAADAGPAAAAGGDAFVRVLEEELRPFVRATYNLSPTNQIIYGQSLGAIIALRILFRSPTAFSTYILSSPALWNNREVLADEEAFAQQARSGQLRIKILVTSAGDEQYRGDDPKRLADAHVSRMVDNASELAARLAALHPSTLTVVRTIFPGEIHNTVPPASLSRSLRFALPLR